MAQGILAHRLAQAGLESVKISSMGIHGLDNQPAAPLARQLCAEQGIDIENHRSRPLMPDELLEADLIFALEAVHKGYLQTFFPQVGDKVFLLAAWPEQEKRKHNIKDPMGKSLRIYRQVYEEIQTHIQRILPLVIQRVGVQG
jgi:protein-tyrosine-phosphatase